MQQLAHGKPTSVIHRYHDFARAKPVAHFQETVRVDGGPVERFRPGADGPVGYVDERYGDEVLVIPVFDELGDASRLGAVAEHEHAPLQQTAPQGHRESSARYRHANQPDQRRFQWKIREVGQLVEAFAPV